MTNNQIYNILYYLEIMWSQNWITISPDYLKEKTQVFFNQLGKKESLTIYTQTYNKDVWINKYCDTWKINSTNYELINILNFIMSSTLENHFYNHDTDNIKFKDVINSFRKYIGDTDKISKNDLSHLAHTKLREHVNKKIRLNLDIQLIRLIKLTNLT